MGEARLLCNREFMIHRHGGARAVVLARSRAIPQRSAGDPTKITGTTAERLRKQLEGECSQRWNRLFRRRILAKEWFRNLECRCRNRQKTVISANVNLGARRPRNLVHSVQHCFDDFVSAGDWHSLTREQLQQQCFQRHIRLPSLLHFEKWKGVEIWSVVAVIAKRMSTSKKKNIVRAR